MAADYPVAGAGVGNFRWAYPHYQSEVDAGRYIDYAHNDYAQLLAEAGAVGFALVAIGLGFFLWRTLRLWHARQSTFSVAVGAGGLAAAFALAIHSYSDFNLHLPANALMLAGCLAVGLAALNIRQRHGLETCLLEHYRFTIVGLGGLVLLPVLMVGWGWSLERTTAHFLAEASYRQFMEAPRPTGRPMPIHLLQTAIVKDPANGKYRNEMGWVRSLMRKWYWRDADIVGRRRLQRSAEQDYKAAVAVNPYDAVSHKQLGVLLTQYWVTADFQERWLPAADRGHAAGRGRQRRRPPRSSGGAGQLLGDAIEADLPGRAGLGPGPRPGRRRLRGGAGGRPAQADPQAGGSVCAALLPRRCPGGAAGAGGCAASTAEGEKVSG
jgi:hypothetical protein